MSSPSSSSSQHGIIYRIHPAFHVSILKPFSPFVPGTEEPVALLFPLDPLEKEIGLVTLR